MADAQLNDRESTEYDGEQAPAVGHLDEGKLDMTELTSITSLRWDTRSEEIRFDVTSGEEDINCRVSFAYLDERFGPLRNIDDFFSGAEAFRSEILIEVRERIGRRQWEADGSLLLRRFRHGPAA